MTPSYCNLFSCTSPIFSLLKGVRVKIRFNPQVKWPHLMVWAAVGIVLGILFYNVVMKG